MVEEASDLAPAESFFTHPSAATSTPDYSAFWQGKQRLPREIEPATPAAVPAILVRKGGDYPAFWDKDASFIEAMQALYLRVREKNKGVLYSPRPADAEPATQDDPALLHIKTALGLSATQTPTWPSSHRDAEPLPIAATVPSKSP